MEWKIFQSFLSLCTRSHCLCWSWGEALSQQPQPIIWLKQGHWLSGRSRVNLGAELTWEDDEVETFGSQEDDDVDLEVTEDVLIIVHTTGVFQHRIRWCTCIGCPGRHMQLFQMRLFSCSSRRPRTVFSFDVLDYFTIDAMECKTAAQSFYTKIRHVTNNAFPHMVPVRIFLSIFPNRPNFRLIDSI